jgi:ABC-type dipeptide/oligopeptide/nickel transport system permease component
MESGVREAYSADFTRTARAKGLSEWGVTRHALRAGLLPVVTVIALNTGFLLGGTVVTENLFVRPGLGRLLLESTLRQDYPVVQGIVVLAAVVYTLLNTTADLFYRLLDPRLRGASA